MGFATSSAVTRKKQVVRKEMFQPFTKQGSPSVWVTEYWIQSIYRYWIAYYLLWLTPEWCSWYLFWVCIISMDGFRRLCFDLCCRIWATNLQLQNCHCWVWIKKIHIFLPGGICFPLLFDTWHCFCWNLFTVISSVTDFYAMGFFFFFIFCCLCCCFDLPLSQFFKSCLPRYERVQL